MITDAEDLALETDYVMDKASRPKRCPDCGGPSLFSKGWAEYPVCEFTEAAKGVTG